MYTVMYLPTADQIWEDGCTFINQKGEHFTYDASAYPKLSTSNRVATLAIVRMEFNQMVIVCRPAPQVGRWLKPGMLLHMECIVPTGDLMPTSDMPEVKYAWIKCPTCGSVHG